MLRRILLEYDDGSVELPPGVIQIGRDVRCRIRFNDPFLSRRHLQIEMSESRLTVEDLGSRNGSLVNGETLAGKVELTDGDEIQLGRRLLTVRILDGAISDETVETRPDYPPLEIPDRDLAEAIRLAQRRGSPQTEPAPAPERDCPRCKATIPMDTLRCMSCGMQFRPGRPLGATMDLDLRAIRERLGGELDRRGELRRELVVPVLYSSPTMTLDAEISDLSRGGMFVASELLDEVGTKCHVTLLPEGAPALPFRAEVVRVVDSVNDASGDRPGMGVRFLEITPRAREWLELVLDRRARSR